MNNLVPGVRTIAVVCLLFLVCVTVHELGHALAGMALGGRIAEFDVFSLPPHVRILGPSTHADTAVKAISGSGFFLGTYCLFMVVVPFRVKPWWLVEALTFFAVVEILGWALSALNLPPGGQANDAVKFMKNSGTGPVTIAAASLLAAGLVYRLVSAHRRANVH